MREFKGKIKLQHFKSNIQLNQKWRTQENLATSLIAWSKVVRNVCKQVTKIRLDSIDKSRYFATNDHRIIAQEHEKND